MPPPHRQAEDDEEGLGWPVPFAGGFATGFFAGVAIRKFTAVPLSAPLPPPQLPAVNPLQEKLDAAEARVVAVEADVVTASKAKATADAAAAVAVTDKGVAEEAAAALRDQVTAIQDQVIEYAIPSEIRYIDKTPPEWVATLDEVYTSVNGGTQPASPWPYTGVADDCTRLARLLRRVVRLYGGKHRGPHLLKLYIPVDHDATQADLRVLMYVHDDNYGGFAVLRDDMTEPVAHHDKAWDGSMWEPERWTVEGPDAQTMEKAKTVYGHVIHPHLQSA